MPKKAKKTAEAETAKPEPAAGSLDAAGSAPSHPEATSDDGTKGKTAGRRPAAKKAPAKRAPAKKKTPNRTDEENAEAALDLEALHRMQSESAATPEGGAVEAAMQAADTFDEAMEPNDPAEVQALGIETETEPDAPAPPVATAETDTEPAEAGSSGEEDEPFKAEPRPPVKLERLQKILARAGVASRRHAEELITEGRVQVNGKIVSELGSKADRNRDHIRVDGKLLRGAERLRYFVLNKPRGFVTTVSDPEGRPTVMQFFAKMNERLYPVGRLDYLSEGLLLVTNDGELANKLTKAASAVEKTYLVKVSGQPTEEQLETLREGVSIDRGKPGEGRVRTSAARIRQVRVGDNPWYEVVLIEGRNRELRKMFEEIGHFVEKIRRVGYGPLVLDQEPGNLRELDEQELKMLRLAADGKWKPKRVKSTAMLPKEAGRRVDIEAAKRLGGKPFRSAPDRPDVRRRQEQDQQRPEGRTSAPESGTRQIPGGAGGQRPPFQKPGFTPRPDDRGQRRNAGSTFGRPQAGSGERRTFSKPPADRSERRTFSKPPASGSEGRGFAKPPADRGEGRRTYSRPPASGTGQRPFRDRPATGGTDKPRFERPQLPARPPRREGAVNAEGAAFQDRKPYKPRTDRPAGAQGGEQRFISRPAKPAGGGFSSDRRRPPQGAGRSFAPRPEGRSERSAAPPRREAGSGPRGTTRPSAPGSRAAFTSSGIPRPGGARPSSGGPARAGFQGRGRTGGGARPGGGPRPGGGRSSSGPRPGNNGSSGFKGKPGGRGGSAGRKRT